MSRTTQAKPEFDAQFTKGDLDLLSNLYRKIGISAVAAALEAKKDSRYTKPQEDDGHVRDRCRSHSA